MKNTLNCLFIIHQRKARKIKILLILIIVVLEMVLVYSNWIILDISNVFSSVYRSTDQFKRKENGYRAICQYILY